jgi:glycosyltransferase involved in cell wall biosynthesis
MPSKGISDLMAVARRLFNRGFKFNLVGPPSVGCEDLQVEVEKHHSQGILCYHGECLGDDLYRHYLDADVFYFPSQGEGMSRAMLEAGCFGLCPLAYDIPANRDLVADGRGYLVETNNVEAVVSRLEQLGADRQTLIHLATNYQKFILENYSTTNYTQLLDSIFRTIILNHTSAGTHGR